MKLIFGMDGGNGIYEKEARVRAFMRMIRVCEGTDTDLGYRKLFRHADFTKSPYNKKMEKHPREVVTKGGYSSSATGANQIKISTYDELNKKILKYGINEFYPIAQDQMCLLLLKYSYRSERSELFFTKEGEEETRKKFRGVKCDIIQKIVDDDVDYALLKASLCWASSPNSPYGQPKKTTDEAKKIYNDYLKEELRGEQKGENKLHLQRGFLKDYGYNCCTINYNTEGEVPWMTVALNEAKLAKGVKESEEPLASMITKYHNNSNLYDNKSTTKTIEDSYTSSWCSSFVNWCLDQTEYKGSKSAASQSVLWQEGKLFKRIDEPVYGCIVVLTNYVVSNGRQTANGHVTFLEGKDKNGDLVCLGGNQGDTLKYSMYFNSTTKGRKFKQDQDEGYVLVDQRLNGFFLPINYPEPDDKELKVINQQKLNSNLGKKSNKPQIQNESTL